MTTGKEGSKPASQRFEMKGFALPHYQDLPPEGLQLAFLGCVSFDVAFEFVRPIFRARLGTRCAAATLMSVPKASMNEYGLSSFGEDQVRSSGQVAPVKAKAVSQGMRYSADHQFGLGILVTNSGHQSRAFRVDVLSRQCPVRDTLRGMAFAASGFRHFRMAPTGTLL